MPRTDRPLLGGVATPERFELDRAAPTSADQGAWDVGQVGSRQLQHSHDTAAQHHPGRRQRESSHLRDGWRWSIRFLGSSDRIDKALRLSPRRRRGLRPPGGGPVPTVRQRCRCSLRSPSSRAP